jgi:hypothetical protein
MDPLIIGLPIVQNKKEKSRPSQWSYNYSTDIGAANERRTNKTFRAI